jgi:hypothetical protein
MYRAPAPSRSIREHSLLDLLGLTKEDLEE